MQLFDFYVRRKFGARFCREPLSVEAFFKALHLAVQAVKKLQAAREFFRLLALRGFAPAVGKSRAELRFSFAKTPLESSECGSVLLFLQFLQFFVPLHLLEQKFAVFYGGFQRQRARLAGDLSVWKAALRLAVSLKACCCSICVARTKRSGCTKAACSR